MANGQLSCKTKVVREPKSYKKGYGNTVGKNLFLQFFKKEDNELFFKK